VYSQIDARRAGAYGVMMAAVLLATLSPATVAAQENSSSRAATRIPGQAEIARALETVKADPNLATERTIKTLRWRVSTETKPSDRFAWLRWIAGLFRWLEESARLLLWAGAVVLAGLLAVYILRIVRAHRVPGGEAAFVPPTYVQDLDIRPESLPKDIGIAARGLWDRGDHRAALALLYRGMLSRLAHVHRVPIRDSSTEGDCLALAASHLTEGRREYASRLVSVWLRFVYGGHDTQSAAVHVLCDGFASALDSASPLESIEPEGAA
jgi:hypothetical protein